MKLIEAMKELKLIQKRMSKNMRHITEYASSVDSEKLQFDNEKDQKKEVASLVQANENLLGTYLGLKSQIEFTNLSTKVDLEGFVYSISELLVLKRKMGTFVSQTFESLNDSRGRNLKRAMGDSKVLTFYDEKKKNEKVDKWEIFMSRIDARLEVVNATTELMKVS